ncbi:MAG: insulinase family protein [Nitrospinae bacterium]|nr:insulinase family protein [Nitrospinota bacterium]
MSINSTPSLAANLKFETVTLKNGLTVNLLQRQEIPILTMSLKVKAGLIMEKEGETGIANLTSELLEMGTKDFTAEKLSDEIDFMGASFGAGVEKDTADMDFEALTKDLDKAIYYFSQIVVHPTFPTKEIEQKKEEIIADLIRQKEKPGTIARKAFLKELYNKHPYSHPADGTIESVKKITQNNITDFYKRNYLPNNSYLSIVGNFDKKQLLSLLEKYFGEWKQGELPTLPENPKELTNKEITFIPMEITQANIIFGHLGISRSNPDFFKIRIMNYILGGGGFASRLLSDLRDSKGLTYGIYSSFATGLEEGSFIVSIQTKNESAKDALQGILEHINKIKQKQVTVQEYEEAMSYLTGSFFMKLDTNRKMADILGAISLHNLGNDYLERYIHNLKSVTRKDILEVAQKYLSSEKYKIVIVGDEKKMGKQEIIKAFQ